MHKSDPLVNNDAFNKKFKMDPKMRKGPAGDKTVMYIFLVEEVIGNAGGERGRSVKDIVNSKWSTNHSSYPAYCNFPEQEEDGCVIPIDELQGVGLKFPERFYRGTLIHESGK